MKLLLDTQVALWWLRGDRRIVKATRQLIETAECFISVASSPPTGICIDWLRSD
jgi:PIN domain nuclease of toxin-antitoxin system